MNVKSYYASHNMQERIEQLYSTFAAMPRETVRRLLEAWDADQGRAMHAAEKSLRKPPCPYEWSPALRNAGIVRTYWKLRIYDARNNMNHSGRMQRLADQVRQHDPSFRLPHRDEPFSMEALEQHLETATLDLRKIQRSAPEHRMHSLYDLLAFYESGASDVSASEARRRSTGLRSSIRNGTTRGTFSNIRQELKPVEQSGLQHVNIPSAALESSDVTPYSYLQQSPVNVV